MTNTLAERRSGRAVGEDLRRRAVAAVLEKGMSARAAGRLYEIGGASVARWVRRFRESGLVRADRLGGDRRSWRIEAERERIFRLLEAQPELGIHALRAALAAEGLIVRLRHDAALPEAPRPRTPERRLARRRRTPAPKDPAAGSR